MSSVCGFSINKQDSIAIEKSLAFALKNVYSRTDTVKKICYLQIQKSEGNEYLLTKSYNYLGILYDVTSNYDSAIICYNIVLEKAKKNHFIVLEGSGLNNLGLIYWNKGEYPLALSYFQKSIVKFEQKNMKEGIASTYNNMGMIFAENKEYEKSLGNYKLAVKYYRGLDNKYGVSGAYINISKSYSNMGNSDSALYYLNMALPLKQEINDKWGMAMCYTNIAAEFKKTSCDSSLVYIKKAEELYRGLNNKSTLALSLSGKANYFKCLGENKKALVVLKEAELLASEMNNKYALRNIHDHYKELYISEKDYKKALYHLELKNIYADSLYSIENKKIIADIEAKYQTAKKDKVLANQKKELLEKDLASEKKNNQMIVLIAICLLVLFVTLFVANAQKNKRKKQRLKHAVEKQKIRADNEQKIADNKLHISRELHDNIGSNMTFLISAIDKMSYLEKDSERKSELDAVSDFGRHTVKELRHTIWAMKNKGASVEELYDRVLDFKSFAKTKIVVENKCSKNYKLNALELLSLFRIIQEGIQNAEKYANANQIHVTFDDADCFSLSITDNGIGFDVNLIEKGSGIDNMQYRCESINGQFKLISSNSGTEINCLFKEIKA